MFRTRHETVRPKSTSLVEAGFSPRISALLGRRVSTVTQLEELAEALLDFTSQSDLINYLANISPSSSNTI
ncbi:DUF4351 domain-containing protein [Anabaena sp. CA = ATCC 33047]|uniref:DUF4351 domain-containing protein n=1 Tax=Anabaena sp. (strain CA / ATCC 33047) TaxID=52271 RepID=UPI000A05C05A|nr:DUF4351 domain-containing protein [Anabaena sp. CA = ATCC 33047]